MDAGTVVLIVVVLLITAGVAGHLIAGETWPIRRKIWRKRAEFVQDEAKRYDHDTEIERPEAIDGPPVRANAEQQLIAQSDIYQAQADELEARAHRERIEADQAEAEARRLRDAAARRTTPAPTDQPTPQRRRAGLSPEDLDY
jgi:hypothetical protein